MDDKNKLPNSGAHPDKTGLEAETNKADNTSSEERRVAVKRILAGSTIAAGTAATATWVKPAIDSVITPAHAQTSIVVVLAGNAGLTIGPRIAEAPSQQQSILDLFVDSANAGAALESFDGACVDATFNLAQNTFTLVLSFVLGTPITLTGSLTSGGLFSGMSSMPSGVSVTGTFNAIANTASGVITDGRGMSGRSSSSAMLTQYNFTLNNSGTCSPLPPTTPTPTTGTPSPYYIPTTTPMTTPMTTPPPP